LGGEVRQSPGIREDAVLSRMRYVLGGS
jgi:hypothetical protein